METVEEILTHESPGGTFVPSSRVYIEPNESESIRGESSSDSDSYENSKSMSTTPPEYEIYELLNSDSIETSELSDSQDIFHDNRVLQSKKDNDVDTYIKKSQKKKKDHETDFVSKKGSLVMLPSSHYSTLLPYQTPRVQTILKSIFSTTNILDLKSIVDCTAHIGGDSIHFSKVFPNATIHAIDIDEEAIKCMKINVEGTNSTPGRFNIIKADSVDWIRSESAKVADFYYFDPPWGGPSYYLEKDIKLFLSGIPIATIINEVFQKGLTTKVLLKTPRNFAYPEFKHNVQGSSKLYAVRKYQQKGAVAYYLASITKKYA